MIENFDAASIQEAAITIGSFVLIGAGANYAQYMHKIETTPEKWQLGRALPTLGVGALAGIVAFLLGLPPELAAVSGVLGGLVPIVDEVRSGTLSFADVYSIARKGGDSPAASARKGGEAAYDEMDMGTVHQGYREVQRVAEEHGEYRDPDEIEEGVPEDVDLDRRAAMGLKPRARADDIVTEGG